MPGSFDLSPVPGGQAVQAMPIVVCLYEPGGENPYTILPNINCLRIDYREGPEPPLARFQYMMGDLLQSALGWPSQFETALADRRARRLRRHDRRPARRADADPAGHR